MRIHSKQEQDVMILTPMEKNIDASIQDEFKAALVEAIDEGHKKIVLDLSHVKFLDSSGLGVMVSMVKKLSGSGALAFCGIQEQVGQVFSLTRLDRVFNIYPNKNVALDALVSKGPATEGAV
ncbi:anti-sigma-factor antagonist [Desulfatibacillum aliphaticivorans]|uniref:Anti-sigma factor antagonist n=1 Tax=Desulfatibacillum aliphaticivorans TaxID=218208 RepID=B8FN12_DESAL|nr:STAS domain-containing protein [Desulfatibacillum aliphaticivorans]ACL05882.1 anti-sigma-factor antagonist [Desulfatibacillum aliphaticivorans]